MPPFQPDLHHCNNLQQNVVLLLLGMVLSHVSPPAGHARCDVPCIQRQLATAARHSHVCARLQPPKHARHGRQRHEPMIARSPSQRSAQRSLGAGGQPRRH